MTKGLPSIPNVPGPHKTQTCFFLRKNYFHKNVGYNLSPCSRGRVHARLVISNKTNIHQNQFTLTLFSKKILPSARL